MPDNLDRSFMARALTLARATLGLASPNPQVGCVLARDGIILGEGAHRYDDRDHAEIVALKQAIAAGQEVTGATAYVTLEPCSHHGRTAPCADALVAAGIARCVIATADPNPLVSGRGLARLRAAGIEVAAGLMQDQARSLNDAFAFSVTHQRPFVTLKAALSVDGHLAPEQSQRSPDKQPFWLTGPEARAEVQQLRHAHDAILTGVGTVLADDPLLTDRTGLPRRRPLLRVVLDAHLRTPPGSQLVTTAAEDLFILHAEDASRDRAAALQDRGAILVAIPAREGHLDLEKALAHLHRAELRSLLLEAGSAVNGAFLRADLVDRVVLFYSELELGAGSIPFAAGTDGPFALERRLLSVDKRSFGPDVCVSGPLHISWPQHA